MQNLFTEEFSSPFDSHNKGKMVHSTLCGQSLNVTSSMSSIKYVLSGEECYYHQGKKFRLRSGDALMVKAGADLKVEISSSNQATGLCLYFEDCDIDKSITSALHYPAGKLFQSKSDTVSKLIQKNAITSTALKEHFYTLLEIGKSAFAENEAAYQKLAKQYKVAAPTLLHKIERTRLYIDEKNGLIRSLDELSSIASLSKHHFSRLFKEIHNQTPIQYATRKKMEFAKEQLEKHSYSVDELSRIIGFADQPSFTKAFKRTYGFPPSKVFQNHSAETTASI